MKNTRRIWQCLLFIAPLLCAPVLMADDAEIYYEQSSKADPNILFLLDTSGSMNTKLPDSGETRIQVMQNVLGEVLSNAPDNLNVGLMRYSGHSDGNNANGASFPVKPINAEALPIIQASIAPGLDNLPNPAAVTPVRQFLADVANSWSAKGYTPIVDSLYEAALYYRGDNVYFGNLDPSHVRAAHPASYKINGGGGAQRQTCNKTAGGCSGENVSDCVTSPHDECPVAMVENTTTLTNQCCGTMVNEVVANDQCCGWEATGLNEDGNWTGAKCTDNNYTCPRTEAHCDAASTCTVPGPSSWMCPVAMVSVAGDEMCQQDVPVDVKQYISPMQYECQHNYIVLMSDGKPEYTGGTADFPPSKAKAEALAGACAASPSGYNSGTCGPELAKFLAEKDQSATLPGKQTVDMFTVAFALDDIAGTEYLKSLATVSGGDFKADNASSLTKAFSDILDKVDASSASFSSPAYTVDAESLLSHGDEVFIPMFERSSLPKWSGNLKKFKLKNGQIMGKTAVAGTDQPALDAASQFVEDAWDYWGASASGSYVKQGGAASLLDPSTRTLYTDAVGTALSSLDKGNTDISKTLLGDAGMANPYREKLLDFARGYDVDAAGYDVTVAVNDAALSRHHMGDVMNSHPLVMDYGVAGESYVLVGTNEGFLHVFNSSTGQEKWAFMPESLLKNIDVFYQNNLPKQHIYGIDGRLTLNIQDVNHDGKIVKTDGDKVHLYFGMRRGSRAYYGLDISDISAPSVLWKVDNTTAGFNELGESWSKPSLAKMRVNTGSALAPNIVLKDVLVFGAGFDAAKEDENPATRPADSMGRDVFIIDAATGKRLWSLRADVTGAAAQLDHSIPADIRVMDMDRNGALDRLYFADTGGNLWRVDMDMDVRDADAGFYDYQDAQLTHLADLGGSGTDKRKFYYEPDVALMRENGKTVMTIALGSGYRSHPQSTAITDRFYVLLDEYVYVPPPTTYTALQDLDITSLDVLEATNGTLLDGKHKGWSYELPNKGEKVLAPAVTFLNKAVFTTFAQDIVAAPDPCAPSPNKARAYVLDLFTGAAVANLDRSADGSKDKSVVAGLNEILDGAQIIFKQPAATDGSVCSAKDCQQGVEIRVGKMNLPIMDGSNSNNAGANVAEKTDLSDILPRMFWNDVNVSK